MGIHGGPMIQLYTRITKVLTVDWVWNDDWQFVNCESCCGARLRAIR
jgi:hypothetical protein